MSQGVSERRGHTTEDRDSEAPSEARQDPHAEEERVGLRPIHKAAKDGSMRTLEQLVQEAGADVDALDDEGNTPLHWAAKHGQAAAVTWLLDRGANRELLNGSNLLPADVASSPLIRKAILQASPTAHTTAFDTPPKPPLSTNSSSSTRMSGRSLITGLYTRLKGAATGSTTEPSPPETPPLGQRAFPVMPSFTSPPPAALTTPVKPPTGRASARKRYSISPRVTRTPRPVTPQLADAVLRAAVDTATCLASPTAEWSRRKEVFDACAMSRATPEHVKIKGLRNKLQQDPGLAKGRAIQLNNLAQDGFTPLHAAASVGNIHAVEALLALPQEFVDPMAVDLQGRTALHVAAENGHVEVVRRLREVMRRRSEGGVDPVGDCAPVDLAGRTPVALGLARKTRRNEIEDELFALGDPSIFPTLPLRGRCGGEELCFGYCSTPGWQQKMEDTLCVHTPLSEEEGDVGLFAVFDGHQGKTVAEYAADSLCDTLLETVAWQSGERAPEALRKALEEACLTMDAKLAEIPSLKVRQEELRGYGGDAVKIRHVADDESGSTAIIALVTSQHIAIANLGDSRLVLLSRTGSDGSLIAVPLSCDHTPDLPDERARVEAAGGIVKAIEFVSNKEEAPRLIYRIFHTEGINNSVMMSRALGDFVYKRNPGLEPHQQMLTAFPEVEVRQRQAEDELLVLACDGVWDVITNEQLATFVHDHQQRNGQRLDVPEYMAELADEIVKESLKRGSRDNITALVVRIAQVVSGERRALFL